MRLNLQKFMAKVWKVAIKTSIINTSLCLCRNAQLQIIRKPENIKKIGYPERGI